MKGPEGDRAAVAVGVARKVEYEDVDDIIGIAAELKEADADRLTLEELQEVGLELDIPAPFVEKAVAELRRRRAVAEDGARQKKRLLIRVMVVGGVGAVALVLTVAATALVAQSSLSEGLSAAEQKRAQVVNVVERQVKIEARYKGKPDSPERDAELSGAENRVRIERKRYDEAAAAYNKSAGTFPDSLWRGLMGYPDKLPLSNDIEAW